MSVVPPLSESLADLSDLRRFGLALTRDDRFVLDHAAAAALVDRLFRQASFEAVDAAPAGEAKGHAPEDARVRAFGQFVRLYRRHARRLVFDEGEAGWDESADSARDRARAGDVDMSVAVRSLPLELREALLIVVLANFTHREAASALDISLATLVTRLTKARERLSAMTRSPNAAATADVAERSIPHLRIVK